MRKKPFSKDDIIFELHLAEEAGRSDALVRLVHDNPELREDLVGHYVEILLMEWRAAHDWEPPCPPIDEAEATRSLACFREIEAEVRSPMRIIGAAGESSPSPRS